MNRSVIDVLRSVLVTARRLAPESQDSRAGHLHLRRHRWPCDPSQRQGEEAAAKYGRAGQEPPAQGLLMTTCRDVCCCLAVVLALQSCVVRDAWAQNVSNTITRQAEGAKAPTSADTSVDGVAAVGDSVDSADHQGTANQRWNVHFQNTDIAEFAAPFAARYSGTHSLTNQGQARETLSTDVFTGARLWSGGEIHSDVLVWQGYGLSRSFGIENFPDADAYKVGTTPPNVMFARLFLQQTFGFGGDQEDVADGPLTLATREDVSRLTLYLGRMSALDIMDHNRYAGDGHLQFMSWAGTANATWDYGQDTVGYETGVAVNLNQRRWALRYSFFLMPPYVNTDNTGSGDGGDDQVLTYPPRGRYGPLTKSWAMASEYERRFTIARRPGAVRLLAWLDSAKTVDYQVGAAVLSTLGAATDLTPYEAYHHSYGLAVNAEQEITPQVGIFSRAGWNDGKAQSLEFTDMNRLFSLGIHVDGVLWSRPHDTFGVAGFLSGASKDNQAYLAAGGLGILEGDGALRYGPELSLTPYYDAELRTGLHVAVQYQLTDHPNFNRDRGPASTVMIRFHYER